MSDERVDQLLRQGQTAAQRGNNDLASDYLRTATDLDPDNTAAWLWLAGVVSDPAEARQALERVLELDPGNIRAQQGLAQLEQSGTYGGGAATGHLQTADEQFGADSGTGALAIEQELRQTLREPAEYQSAEELDPENLGAEGDGIGGSPNLAELFSGEEAIYPMIATALSLFLVVGICCFVLVLTGVGPFAPR